MTSQLELLAGAEYSAELSQWYTPRRLAERVVAWALEGVERPLTIVEPSAGDGALIRPVPLVHTVTAYELDRRRIAGLLELDRGPVVNESWLRRPASVRYDLAVMNPPYEHGQDMVHTFVATECCDRVVVILRLAALSGVAAFDFVWSKARIRRLAILRRRPRFEGPQRLTPSGGTVVVELIPGALGPGEAIEPAIEWW